MSWSELLIVGIVALIVVGPKDLPGMFRTLGQFTAKAKRMARDFSRAMEDAADNAGVADVQKTFQAAVNPAKAAADSVTDTLKKTVDFDSMDPTSETAKLAKKRQNAKAAAEKRANAAKEANAAATEQAKEFAKTAKTEVKEAAPKKAAKPAAKKAPAKKAPAKKATAKNTPAKKTQAKKAATKKASDG